MGRCSPPLPGDTGNTWPALLGTSSSLRLRLLGAQRRQAETVKAALLCSFVVCTQELGKVVWLSLTSHTCSPTPTSLAQEERKCTEWTAHTTASELPESVQGRPHTFVE